MHDKLRKMIEVSHIRGYTITTFLPEPHDIYSSKVQMLREHGWEVEMDGTFIYITRDGEHACIRRESLDLTATLKGLIDDAFKHVINEDLLHVTGDHQHVK